MNQRRADQVCKIVLTDSCAVQNVLSSATLDAACQRHGFCFALTKYCLYECLEKPRKRVRPGDDEIRRRLRDARVAGRFLDCALSVEDLQEAGVMRIRRRLGSGELSTIALAKRMGMAIQTDDDKAERFAAEVLSFEKVQTTPHVLGWLFFQRHLEDHQLHRRWRLRRNLRQTRTRAKTGFRFVVILVTPAARPSAARSGCAIMTR